MGISHSYFKKYHC